MKTLPVILLLVILLSTVNVQAQLPPVFGSEYEGKTQNDELTRTYISPLRVVWKSDTTGEFIKNSDVLLKMGNSQSDMSRQTRFCNIQSTETDTASIFTGLWQRIARRAPVGYGRLIAT